MEESFVFLDKYIKISTSISNLDLILTTLWSLGTSYLYLSYFICSYFIKINFMLDQTFKKMIHYFGIEIDKHFKVTYDYRRKRGPQV